MSTSKNFLDEVTINGQNHSNVETILNEYCSSKKDKTCLTSKTYAEHLETTKIFLLVVLPFENSLNKIDKNIELNRVTIFGIKFQLNCIMNTMATL